MSQTTTNQTTCPQCGKGLRYRQEMIGKVTKCPGCEHRFRLGPPAAASPAAPVAKAPKTAAPAPEGKKSEKAAPDAPKKATRPKKKKALPQRKESGRWVAWGVLAGTLLVAFGVVGGVGYFIWMKINEPPTNPGGVPRSIDLNLVEPKGRPQSSTPAPVVASASYGYGGYGGVTVGQFKDNVQTNTQVKDGDLELVFKDAHGNPVALGEYRGKKHLVLVVTRGLPADGMVCPNCAAQTSRLTSNYAKFKEREAEVLVIFPGPTANVNAYVARSLEETKGSNLPFPVLLDENYENIDKLGIRGDQAKPSTYIIDKQGKVRFAYVGANTADRPTVQAMLNELDKIARS